MSWATRTKIGRQALFELSKENDFTINLKGSEWDNPQFFISIKSIKYPKVLKSIRFDIKKLSILNSYKIESVIDGIIEDKEVITKNTGVTKVTLNNCYGFSAEWGGGTDEVSYYYIKSHLSVNISNGSTQETVEPIYMENTWDWDTDKEGGTAYGEKVIENFNNSSTFTLEPLSNSARYPSDYTWNFITRKYIRDTYIDNEIILTVLVIENTTNNNLKRDNISRSSWVDVSKLYSKSLVYQFEKSEIINFFLSNYSKKIKWKNSEVIVGATSLYTKNNNEYYELELNKINDDNYKITNKSLAFPNKITINNSNRILLYDRNDGTKNTPYSINTFKDFNLYIKVDHEVLNQFDKGFFTIDIYNNGILNGTLDNRRNSYNWIGKTMMWGRNYSWFFSTYYMKIKASSTGKNSITAKITWSDGSTMSIWVYINHGSNYIDTSKETVTYNDTLIYAFENN